MSLVNPSFSNGFSSPWYGGRMKYADLWRGCVGAWAPLIGPTGATLFDFSGWQKHAPMTGFTLSSAWGVDQRGQQLTFNGSSTYAASSLLMPCDAPFSIFSWVKKTVDSQNGVILAGRKYPSGSACAFVLGSFINGTADTRFSMGRFKFGTNNGYSVISSAAVANNEWMLLGAVISANNVITLSVNGRDVAATVEYSSNPTASVATSGNAWIGHGEDASTYLTGSIATVAIWDRVVTSSEMQLLAQRPGIMYELDDSDVWGAVEAGGATTVPWYYYAQQQVVA